MSTVTIDEEQLLSVLKTVLNLMEEHAVFKATTHALHVRISQVEESLGERTKPLTTFDSRLRHQESRFDALHEELQRSEDRLISLAENFATRLQAAKNTSLFNIPMTPQMEAAKEIFQRYIDNAEGNK
jgi:hypothetical protein